MVNTSDDPRQHPEEPADPFDLLTSLGEVAGFIHKRYGPDGLRQLLSDSTTLTQEDVLDIASELRRAGLRTAAGIATEIAATKLAMDDMAFCPYLTEPYLSNPNNQTNIDHWHRIEQRRQHERELRREQRFKPKPQN